MSNQWCHICGGLVDHIGMQPQDVRLCACGGKIAKLRARIAELEAQVAAQHDAMRTEWKDLLARAERAEAALRQLGKHPESCGDDCVSELARLDLLAERDALRADVERYRWLRSHSDGFWSCHEKDGYGGDVLKYGGDLDAAIDAARGG